MQTLVAATREDRPQTIRPNPFSAATTIEYAIASPQRVDLRIFDIRGRLVRVLENGVTREAGLHRVEWDGRNSDGQPMPSGIYFSALHAGTRENTTKLVLLRTE